ncbi:MAG: TIGR01212 family radical SAM protein [Clostridia bacterium]
MENIISLNDFLRERFGRKVAKLSIDAGFSCPNREGDGKGCYFCSENGGAGHGAERKLSISDQLQAQKDRMRKKWNPGGFIAYFQSFSNTYGPVDLLRKYYDEAMKGNDMLGLAIATRPDCIGEEVLRLLDEYNKKTFLWVELGFQTSNEHTAQRMNRGYGNHVYDECVEKLHACNIRTVTHLIAGLPGERREDFLASAGHVASLPLWGVKLHNLYIQSDSPAYEPYLKGVIPVLSMDEYIDMVCGALECLPEGCIVHRLTGDGDREKLVAPSWTKNKLLVLTSISREWERRKENRKNQACGIR